MVQFLRCVKEIEIRLRVINGFMSKTTKSVDEDIVYSLLKYRETEGVKDSFSLLHTLAYSIIALQELNLNYRYNPLYWNTACLTVNSGGVENEEESDDPDKKEEDTKQITVKLLQQ